MVGKKISVKVTALDGEVVTSDATAAVVKDLPELVNVIQESSNQIRLKFDSDASEIAASDIEVSRDEDGLVIPVEKVEFYTELDSTTLLATLSSVLIDDTDYDVTVGDVTTSFTASVGEVASILILTTEAEVNKPTKIEYKLLDENSVDVTSTQKLKETVLVDITGTYKTAKTSDPTDVSVTMGAVKDECEVTISYSTGDGEDEEITKTQKITCVGPTAAKGTIKYEKTNDINANSNCARFYLDGVGTSGKVTLYVGEDTELTGKPVYFAAFDDNGAAIEYDQYEVESANEAIVAAKVNSAFDSGKFTRIELVGNEKGTTQVKVIATSNTDSREYFINVTVKDIEDMVKITLSSKRNRSLSNAYDEDYYDTITAKIVDDNNDAAIYETVEWELKNKDNYKVDTDAPADLQGKFGWVNAAGYDKAYDGDDITADVKAWGAANGSYTVTATADIADTKISQNISINVKKLPSKAWKGQEGVKLTYEIEVGSPSMDNINKKNSVKLYAMTNGMFAGYVRQVQPVAAGDNGAGKYHINTNWTVDHSAWVTTNVDDVGVAVATNGAITAVTAAEDADVTAANTVTKITIWSANPANGGVEEGSYDLTRVNYNDYPAAQVDLDALSEYGVYWLANAGEATDGGEITIGWKNANAGTTCDADEGTVDSLFDTAISDGSITWYLQFGNKKLATQALYGFLENAADPQIAFFTNKVEPVSDRAKAGVENGFLTYIANDKTYDYDIARPGRYNVVFNYVLKKTFKSQKVENEFRVVDKVASYVPTVTLLTKNAESYDYNSFKDILELNVDLNNANGLSESLIAPGLINKWVDTDANGRITEWNMVNSNDKYAKYAIVEDTYGTSGIHIYFFVPVGSNIYED